MSWLKRISPWSKEPEITTPDDSAASAISSEQQVIFALRKSILELKVERNRLTEERDDYKLQVERFTASRVLHPEEEAEIARLRSEHNQMKEQQDKLALWLRNNKKAEIESGAHKGMEFSDIILKYLGASSNTAASKKEPIQ